MKVIKYGLLFALLLLCIPVCCVITINDVQALDINSFFGGWSKFLDQVLDARPALLSPENETLYQAFIQRAAALDIPKVTGDKDAIAGMKKQMDLIKKRISDEKNFFDEWAQFCDAVTSAHEYPISAENEKSYEAFVERGKALSIKTSALEELQTKMDAIREKLSKESMAKKVPSAENVSVEAPKAETVTLEELIKE